jgi:hypothetical protein
MLSKKPLLFKSFIGLTVQEFDNIYNKKIAKNMKNTRASGYHAKEKKTEKERLVL